MHVLHLSIRAELNLLMKGMEGEGRERACSLNFSLCLKFVVESCFEAPVKEQRARHCAKTKQKIVPSLKISPS